MRALPPACVVLLLGCASSPPADTPAPASVEASPQPPAVVVSQPSAPANAIAGDPKSDTSPDAPHGEGDEPLGTVLAGSDEPLSVPSPRRSPPRAAALLRAELSALERLLAATPKTAPDWPRIAERIGHGYGELAAAATVDGKREEAREARRKAVEHFTSLARETPAYRRLDEVRYAMGVELLELGDRTAARRAWLELIKQTPQSKLVPHVYLGFAELFFDEAAADPSKLQLAKQTYQKVLTFPPPANGTWGYAAYKLGWVHFNLGELPESVAAFQKAVEFSDQYANTGGTSALAREARKDLVRAYARAGRPRTAWAYFQRVNNGDDARTLAMISRLGDTYLQDGQSREALELFHDVAAGHASPNACRAIERVIPSLQQAGAQASEVARLEARIQAACADRR